MKNFSKRSFLAQLSLGSIAFSNTSTAENADQSEISVKDKRNLKAKALIDNGNALATHLNESTPPDSAAINFNTNLQDYLKSTFNAKAPADNYLVGASFALLARTKSAGKEQDRLLQLSLTHLTSAATPLKNSAKTYSPAAAETLARISQDKSVRRDMTRLAMNGIEFNTFARVREELGHAFKIPNFYFEDAADALHFSHLELLCVAAKGASILPIQDMGKLMFFKSTPKIPEQITDSLMYEGIIENSYASYFTMAHSRYSSMSLWEQTSLYIDWELTR